MISREVRTVTPIIQTKNDQVDRNEYVKMTQLDAELIGHGFHPFAKPEGVQGRARASTVREGVNMHRPFKKVAEGEFEVVHLKPIKHDFTPKIEFSIGQEQIFQAMDRMYSPFALTTVASVPTHGMPNPAAS